MRPRQSFQGAVRGLNPPGGSNSPPHLVRNRRIHLRACREGRCSGGRPDGFPCDDRRRQSLIGGVLGGLVKEPAGGDEFHPAGFSCPSSGQPYAPSCSASCAMGTADPRDRPSPRRRPPLPDPPRRDSTSARARRVALAAPEGRRPRLIARNQPEGSRPGSRGADGRGSAPTAEGWLVVPAFRVAINTAMVQVGARSTMGTSSARNAGAKARCHPTRATITAATTTSRTSLATDAAPSAKTGNKPSCTASATTAMIRAAMTRRRV